MEDEVLILDGLESKIKQVPECVQNRFGSFNFINAVIKKWKAQSLQQNSRPESPPSADSWEWYWLVIVLIYLKV